MNRPEGYCPQAVRERHALRKADRCEWEKCAERFEIACIRIACLILVPTFCWALGAYIVTHGGL